jgi:hypothetical protein
MFYKQKGISVLDRDKEGEVWHYGQGILFTVTVVTTIGEPTLHSNINEFNGKQKCTLPIV